MQYGVILKNTQEYSTAETETETETAEKKESGIAF